MSVPVTGLQLTAKQSKGTTYGQMLQLGLHSGASWANRTTNFVPGSLGSAQGQQQDLYSASMANNCNSRHREYSAAYPLSTQHSPRPGTHS